tara:strand:- start:155 stop:292 length:138 start_codon:yes stop_codon:yes gene_type:complete
MDLSSPQKGKINIHKKNESTIKKVSPGKKTSSNTTGFKIWAGKFE